MQWDNLKSMKECVNCKKNKNSNAFDIKRSAKDGLQSWCKQCKRDSYIAKREDILKSRKTYYEENKEHIAHYKQKYNKTHREHINAYYANRRKDDVKRAKDNKTAAAKIKQRRHTCVMFRLMSNVRRRLNHVFRGKNRSKRTVELLGTSIDNTFRHLESLFQPGMTWDNYGKWHVDHIYPLSLAKNTQELENLCHFSNLQPLWAKDNLKKSNKIQTPIFKFEG